MKCPFCGDLDNKVIDSRLSKEGLAIRRRRECIKCDRRFTTYEVVEEIPLAIIKKDSRREPFNREKMRAGVLKACEKRNISIHDIDLLIDTVERELRECEDKEIPSAFIGKKIMDRLKKIDGVAYVRFASVYREFKDVAEFVTELEQYLQSNMNNHHSDNGK
ncbi:MAG: transcriptional repressor NrdR [Candidatus Magnetoglobus multicellularis str. Araruama]|uniref:Transcriptional repressor NrdR n=1 Tax=Candidatus Magnetoglobus multicellularis str. Araruama TaxID=890399 RepID=A0A1V1P586_9BACT|nr:MAG: transcriptional repressor NrdR [Candidatus Magnetoglobus multicellularis str. Araruama]